MGRAHRDSSWLQPIVACVTAPSNMPRLLLLMMLLLAATTTAMLPCAHSRSPTARPPAPFHRPVVQAALVALPDGRSRYTVRTTILFVSKPNGFIKAMIDKGGQAGGQGWVGCKGMQEGREGWCTQECHWVFCAAPFANERAHRCLLVAGAREGQRKNFEALRKALAQHTRVSEAPAALPAAPAPAAAEAAPAVEPQAVAPAAAAGLLETLAGTTAFHQLQPWAAWLHTRLDAAAPAVAVFVDTQVLLALLCMAALLGALRLVVDMLLFIQHAAAQPRDTIGLLTHHLLRVRPGPWRELDGEAAVAQWGVGCRQYQPGCNLWRT